MPDADPRTGAPPSAVDAARYVLAVRERRGRATGTGVLEARVQLAHALECAGMHREATEVLTATVTDASSVYGPGHERTLSIRLLLGHAHVAAEDPITALCVYLTLLDDAVELGVDHASPLVRAIGQSARKCAVLVDAL